MSQSDFRFNIGDKVQYVRQGTLHTGTVVSRGPWKVPDEAMPAWYGVRTRPETPKDIPVGTTAYANWVTENFHLRRHFKDVYETELEPVDVAA